MGKLKRMPKRYRKAVAEKTQRGMSHVKALHTTMLQWLAEAEDDKERKRIRRIMR